MAVCWQLLEVLFANRLVISSSGSILGVSWGLVIAYDWPITML